MNMNQVMSGGYLRQVRAKEFPAAQRAVISGGLP
jgi:hypothetical protein